MLRRQTAVSTLLAVSLLIAACGGGPPEKEMQQAQQAIDAARAGGADRYAAEEFAAAEDALQQANTAVTQRDFRLALNHALDSRERADTALGEAATKKAAARTEAERGLAAGRNTLEAARARLKTVESSRTPATALAAPRESIDTAALRMQEADTAFASGDYISANTATVAAMQALSAANTALDTATPAPTRRKR